MRGADSKQVSVAVGFSDVMFSQYSVPGMVVGPFSSTEITEDDELLRLHLSDEGVELPMKLILGLFRVCHGWSISADDGCI